MDCIIISGMSGGGKSLAVDVLEDIGFYCVDNMPVSLIPQFVDLFIDSSAKYKRVAFVVDVRAGSDYQRIEETVNVLKLVGVNTGILFLDCSDEGLINRYKETRRRHPLASGERGIAEAIAEERQMMEEIKGHANYLIDTTSLSSGGLRQHLTNLFSEGGSQKSMVITIHSFGFKYGVPHESDMVFDVRFIKNPYYIAELRDKTGKDKEVADFVLNETPDARIFMDKLCDMLDFLIPRYIAEGKTSLVISIGCTGGHHRSVALSEQLYSDLTAKGHNVIIRHRDITKG